MRIIATAAALAALMAAPATAQAAETAYVASGVLTYTSAPGQVDHVSVNELSGLHLLSETATPSGSPGPGCTVVNGYPTVACAGVTSAKLSSGDMDDRVVVHVALPATVDAGPGADTVRGGGGADVLDGGAGLDTVSAGSGDDRVAARDGEVDTIDCGPGDDRATVDPVDVVVNCEVDPPPPPPVVVSVPEVPAADPPPPPALPVAPLPPASPVSLVAGEVRVRDGVAPLPVACAATEVAGCKGEVFLDPAPAAKPAKPGKAGKAGKAGKGVRALAARRGRYGRSPFQIAAGRRANLKVSLTPLARKQLGLPGGRKARAARRGRRIKAVVTVVQHGKAPQRSVVELRG